MIGTGYSYSKISLSLAITGKRGDLHEIDMITIPYKRYMDSVSFKYNQEKRSITDITITTSIVGIDNGRFISFIKEKLISICDFYGIYGSFDINKGVPLGAGIGGSATAIAAAIKAVEKVAKELDIDKQLTYADMVKLGSDVPCVYYNKPCRVQGVGELISDIKNEKYYYLDHLIFSGVDTKKAYEYYDNNLLKREDIPTTIEEAINFKRNDLEASAVVLNREIKQTLDDLRGEGKIAIVSGCGSTVFEISKDKLIISKNK